MKLRSGKQTAPISYATGMFNMPLELISRTNSFLSLADFNNLSMACSAFSDFELYNGSNFKNIQVVFDGLLRSCSESLKVDLTLANIIKRSVDICVDCVAMVEMDRFELCKAVIASFNNLGSQVTAELFLGINLYLVPSIRICQVLLDGGADVNFIPEDIGSSCLIAACEKPSNSVVQFLLDNGADLEFRDSLDRSALIIAIKTNNDSLFDLLVKAKANYSHISEFSGISSLIMAALFFNLPAYSKLLNLGVDSETVAMGFRAVDLLFSVNIITEVFKKRYEGLDTGVSVKSIRLVLSRYQELDADQRLEREREIVDDLMANITYPSTAVLSEI